jgi:hypothetical protein
MENLGVGTHRIPEYWPARFAEAVSASVSVRRERSQLELCPSFIPRNRNGLIAFNERSLYAIEYRIHASRPFRAKHVILANPG